MIIGAMRSYRDMIPKSDFSLHLSVPAFLISTLYLPYIWTGSSAGKWVIAAIATACLCKWHWSVVAFIVYLWMGAGSYDAAAKWTIIALAFTGGYSLRSILPVLCGFGCGIGVNSALAIAQTFGFDGLVQAVAPAGTYLNKNLLAEAACLIIVAAATYKIWWVVAISTPSLVLPLGRAALVATVVGLIASFASWRWRVCLLIAAAVLVPFVSLNSSTLVDERIAIWGEVLQQLTWFGHGIGSWSGASIDTIHFRTEYMHNDWLQLVYELGLVSLFIFAIMLRTLGGFTLALFIIGFMAFPMHEPATAWFAATMLGYLCGNPVVSIHDDERIPIRKRMGHGHALDDRYSPQYLSLGSTDKARACALAHEYAADQERLSGT